MKQKREMLFAIGVAENPYDPRDEMQLEKDLAEFLKDILGKEDLLYVQHCDDEWGEPV